ncbi:MAG: FtsH protease activity modulator HflK [Alphaproteobacteria bacterium]|nr:FtsH protease activity modulator HflK [Alphaproteobacteria bacterium]MBU2084407.1 FtsH protease activity modulator HflK [Alphaproteobacteria bacterium]MBU2142415.1 FtsH protease activity modulator HflK [Alphaproteobacteria bacterium]MBU2196856.1 FtsH protease activity modulator HflK [Alphaproteobacteria bacterium]
MPWDDKNKSGGPWGGGSEDEPGKDAGSPWTRPSSGGGNNNDLEAQMKRMQERFRKRSNGNGGGGGRRGGGTTGPNFGPLGFVVLVGIALLGWLSTSVVMVDPTQQAAVFRFGKWQTNFGPGLHFHLPAPLEEHVLVEVENRKETRIGNTLEESLMLTQDENIVDIQFSVFWKVDSEHPENFILNVKNPNEAVEQVAESVMREVVGKTRLQSVITTERDVVQQEARKQVQALLDDYRAGIQVLSITIDKSDPPQQVIEAFNDVNVAEQDAETNVNQATQFANEVVPQARGTAQRILQESEAYRDQVLADAQGEASRFEQIYEEYRKAPRVTRERMYLETMERVLERSDKLIMDQESGAVPYLPLERTQRTTNGGQQ